MSRSFELAAAALAAAIMLPAQAPAQDLSQVERRLDALRARAQLLRDHDAIENLQAAYGYYTDKMLWDSVADLFADTGSFEWGQRGVYVGKERIRSALLLFGSKGPGYGKLNTYMQLQPVIHVAPDGKTAKARWRGMVQLARPDQPGQWGEGVYENEYVKDGGVWKISRLHFYVTAFVDYDLGFDKSAHPLEGPSALLPPDRPPTEIYRSYPGVYIPPFHYPHPVTGKPIDIGGQPADSVLGRTKP